MCIYMYTYICVHIYIYIFQEIFKIDNRAHFVTKLLLEILPEI